ncbi:MAG: hypothetical protein ACJASY_003138 [Halioglobus sp.]
MTSKLEKLQSGAGWSQFCDQLKTAGALISNPDVPLDTLTRAEGYRYLTRLLRLSLEKNIEFADAQYPQFYSLSHETAKIGNDNPDNFYQNCAVCGTRDYLIKGNRGTVAYLSIESKAGSFASGGDMSPTGHVELGELDIDAQGNFELMVSATPCEGNWLPMTSHSDNLLVRQTFGNRSAERRAELSIKCLNPLGETVLRSGKFADQLATVMPFVTGTSSLFHQWMQQFSKHINQLPPNDQEMCLKAGGDPSIYYHNSFWRVERDGALLVTFTPPSRCRTWNFQLSNYWMESLDYRYHQISFSNFNAVSESDGSICIVVAHSDPGSAFPNWVTTADHVCGGMLLRYVEAEDFPPITTRLLPFSELSSQTSGPLC